MSDENDQEKSDLENSLRWWVRYAGIPLVVAVIAGVAVVAVAILTRIIPEARIPAPPQAAASPTVRETPPIFNIVVTVIAPSPIAFSPTPTPTATPTTTPTPTFVPIGQHTVQSGETLYCIGRAYGVQPNAIAQANNLVSPFILHSGQVLKIPAAPWVGVPPGPTCQPQFTSPFTTATSMATPIPATNTPTITFTSTATPTGTATATSTPTVTLFGTATPGGTPIIP